MDMRVGFVGISCSIVDVNAGENRDGRMVIRQV